MAAAPKRPATKPRAADSPQPEALVESIELPTAGASEGVRLVNTQTNGPLGPVTRDFTERGPAGNPTVRRRRVTATTDLFVVVPGLARELAGKQMPAVPNYVFYERGSLLAEKHHDLPTVPAAREGGRWVPVV